MDTDSEWTEAIVTCVSGQSRDISEAVCIAKMGRYTDEVKFLVAALGTGSVFRGWNR